MSVVVSILDDNEIDVTDRSLMNLHCEGVIYPDSACRLFRTIFIYITSIGRHANFEKK